MIELDVQLTADGELVVIHDFDLERTTSGCGSVRSQTLSALKQLDIGSWFDPKYHQERILTLSEVLELVGNRSRLNVEVKPTAGDEDELAAKLVALLHSFGKVDSTIVSCFDFSVLRRVRSCDPHVPLGLLTHDPDFTAVWSTAHELEAQSVHPHWALVTPDLVEKARDARLRVIVWTVNDPQGMRNLLELGVDGIISDFPELFDHV